MTRANQSKRKAAYKFLVNHYGEERADYLLGEGWTTVYRDLEQNGFTWSEREQRWQKSTRPAKYDKPVNRPLARYAYARITVNCAVADIEVNVDAWRQLVDLYGYSVWRYEAPGQVDGAENVRLTIFIRKAL